MRWQPSSAAGRYNHFRTSLNERVTSKTAFFIGIMSPVEDVDDAFLSIDLAKVWEDIDSEITISSDESSKPIKSDSRAGPALRTEQKQRRKKSRGRRKEEITELREEATALQGRLELLKLHTQVKSRAAQSLVVWKSHADRELRARRASEKKNRMIHVTLGRQVKISHRLMRLIAKSSHSTRTRLATLSESSVSDTSEAPSVSFSVHDESSSNTVTIDMGSTWTFTDQSPMTIAQAVWSRYRADQVDLSFFRISYERVFADEHNLQTLFKISTASDLAFEGAQLVRRTFDPTTHEIDISDVAQTLPREKGVDMILDVTMFKNDTRTRISPMDSMGLVSVNVARKFQIQTSQANPLHRRAVADAAAQHFKEEIQ